MRFSARQRLPDQEEEMLEHSEIASRQSALIALMKRGRISGPMVEEHRDEIAKIMDPLPPPWKWEELRQRVGMTAKDMAAVADLHQHRIRYYESGNGTSHPENWIDYAMALLTEVSKRSDQIYQSSLTAPQARVIENDSVRALAEQMRVANNSLRIWIGQQVECNPDDIAQLWDAVRQSKRIISKSEIDLRKRMQQPHADNPGRNQ